MQAESKICFVTVGTTSFDRLIVAVNSPDVRKVLKERHGITHLVIQYGRGKVIPDLESEYLTVSAFDFKPTLAQEMKTASLIISHAGAGSIMESLRLQKPLVVVVNDELMDNHQIELARAMERGDYLAYAAKAEQLVDVLTSKSLTGFKVYPERDTSAFANLVYEELGLLG